VRPGGRVVCLEIARPRGRLGRLIASWFDHIVPLIGRLAGQGSAYAYLVQSTKDYPDPEQIAQIMRDAGLVNGLVRHVRWHRDHPYRHGASAARLAVPLPWQGSCMEARRSTYAPGE